MKQLILLFVSLVTVGLFAFIYPPGQLVGRWQKRLPNGLVLGAVFRRDSSYDGFANGKTFVNGKYYIQQDTLHIQDGGCGGNYYGTYRLTFVTNDSIRFTAIQDTCRGRRQGSDGLMMGRVKSDSSK